MISGQDAYEAHLVHLPGSQFPPWDKLNDHQRACWDRLAKEARQSVAERMYESFAADNRNYPYLMASSESLPTWEALSPDTRAGWHKVAQAAAYVPEAPPETIEQWQKAIHAYAVAKGWWDKDNRSFGDICTLLTCEISEAYEEYRNGRAPAETYYHEGAPDKPEGIPTELADVVIRILDYCGRMGIDLQAIMAQKHAYNLTRPYRHGGKVA